MRGLSKWKGKTLDLHKIFFGGKLTVEVFLNILEYFLKSKINKNEYTWEIKITFSAIYIIDEVWFSLISLYH